MGLIISLGISLFLTLILEWIFAFFVRLREPKDWALVGAVNCITNPAVVLCYYGACSQYGGMPADIIKYMLELSAAGLEAYYYMKYAESMKHPILFSLGANVFSYGMGVVLNNLAYHL